MQGCYCCKLAGTEAQLSVPPTEAVKLARFLDARSALDFDAQDTDQDPKAFQKGSHVPVMPDCSLPPSQAPTLMALSQYYINLVKKDSASRVHVDVDYGNGKTLKVRRVKNGLVKEFNTEHPDKKVEVGDSFLVINGKFGDSKVLLNELLYAPTLEILVEKSATKPYQADTSSTCTSEPSSPVKSKA
mmetsp:Transcript_104927/g.165587  ORF Transcript_104927/g.165587 Transcript_104927/m.165587 type:complete len:187 (+) Transcript_104927:67-627(+)